MLPRIVEKQLPGFVYRIYSFLPDGTPDAMNYESLSSDPMTAAGEWQFEYGATRKFFDIVLQEKRPITVSVLDI